jgi:hypothetical protein
MHPNLALNDWARHQPHTKDLIQWIKLPTMLRHGIPTTALEQKMAWTARTRSVVHGEAPAPNRAAKGRISSAEKSRASTWYRLDDHPSHVLTHNSGSSNYVVSPPPSGSPIPAPQYDPPPSAAGLYRLNGPPPYWCSRNMTMAPPGCKSHFVGSNPFGCHIPCHLWDEMTGFDSLLVSTTNKGWLTTNITYGITLHFIHIALLRQIRHQDRGPGAGGGRSVSSWKQ